MSKIEILDLPVVGIDLFESSESFLTELKDDEMHVMGGLPFFNISIVDIACSEDIFCQSISVIY